MRLELSAVTSPDGRVAGKPQPEPSELLFAYSSAPAFEEAVSFGGSETCRGSDGVEVFRWSSSNKSLGELAGGFARLQVANTGTAPALNLTVTATLCSRSSRC